MDPKSFPYILSLGSVWGLNLVLSRFGLSQFDPSIFVGLRFAIAVLIFAGIYAFSSQRRWSRSPRLWRNAMLTGVAGTAIPFICFTTALEFQSAGLTSLLVTTAPAILVTVAHFALPDARLNRATALGVIVAFSGALLIVVLGETGLPNVSEANPWGYGLVFFALIMDSCVNVYIRKYMQSDDTFDVTSIRMLTAMVIILPAAYWFNPPDFGQVTISGWSALAFTAVVSTFIAQLLAFYIVRTYGTTSMAMVAYIVPIVAILSGVVLLGETLSWGIVTGMVLIISGILIVNHRKFSSQPQA